MRDQSKTKAEYFSGACGVLCLLIGGNYAPNQSADTKLRKRHINITLSPITKVQILPFLQKISNFLRFLPRSAYGCLRREGFISNDNPNFNPFAPNSKSQSTTTISPQ